MTTLKNGRYLVYLDLLGFSKMVKENSLKEVIKIIDSALAPFRDWEQQNGFFKTIYFSDTFLFFQESKGYCDRVFLDAYALGGMILSALLAQKIPARGTITFGEFHVALDSSSRHLLYCGKALVEAYEAEKQENWIGISIQKSAWEPYEAHNLGVIAAFEREGVWKRTDDVILLNNFLKLRSWYIPDLSGEISTPYLQWNKPEFPNDILGFKFIHDKATEYSEKGDFTSREAGKYFSTIAFLKDVMGTDMYNWAIKISQ